jgi:hypothetical protein
VWVDSLNPEHLENALADVMGDIMALLPALTSNLCCMLHLAAPAIFI